MPQSYEDRLLRVLAYIHDNPAGDLSLDTLADVAAMSRFHWHRVFHAMTGETCAKATRRIRLHRAACWLVQTEWPVAEVAEKAGYGNLASFTRAFSEAYGHAPAAFRSRGEETPSLLTVSKGTYPMQSVEILEQPARRLAGLAHQGNYLEIGKVFEQLSAIFASRDLWRHAEGMIGVYYDDPWSVPEPDLRSFGAISVDEEFVMADPMTELRLPGGRYAVMHYKGPYSDLKGAYDYLYGEWLPKSGQEAGDHPPVEIYLNSPAEVAPEELLTDVCVPLK